MRMDDFETTVLVCLGLMQLVGLISGLAARLSAGGRFQAPCQWLFIVCLILVGGSTVFSLGIAPGWWLGSGATLAVMVLIAVCDFGPSRRALVR